METKFADTDFPAAALATSWAPAEDGTVLSLAGIAIGDTESTRDGRAAFIKSLHIHGSLSLDVKEAQTAPVDQVRARIVVVWDKQTNAAQLSANTVYLDNGTAKVDNFRNLQHSTRYAILMDKTITLKPSPINEGAVNAFASPKTIVNFTWNKTFPGAGIKVLHKLTTNVIAGITDNSFHMIAVADSTAAKLQYQVRCRFTG